jgi:hypothetical protein
MRLILIWIISCAFVGAARAEQPKYGATVRAPERQAAVLGQAIRLQREFRPLYPRIGMHRGGDTVHHTRFAGRATFQF